MGKLWIFRGLPGSGKSTAARALAAEIGCLHVEPDMFLIRRGEYFYNADSYERATSMARNMVFNAGQMGADIVYADVLPSTMEVKYMIWKYQCGMKAGGVGSSFPVEVKSLIISRDESIARNRHCVRVEDIDRMIRDWADYPDGQEIVTIPKIMNR